MSFHESTTALPVLEEISFNLFLSGKDKLIQPKFKIHAKVGLFGFYKSYNFIVFEDDLSKPRTGKSIFWSLKPLNQELFRVGEEVLVIYDVKKIDHFVEKDICLIYSG